MITKHIKRNSIFVTVISALMAGFIMLIAAPTASASCTVDPVGHCSGDGYFNAADGPQYSNFGQVIVSGFTTDGADPAYRADIDRVGFASSTSNVVTKSSFINFIEGQISGGGRDATGGQFIVQLMRGGTDFGRPSSSDITDWENRINNPDIEIVYSSSQSWGNWNSGYMKGVANDDAFINESGSSPALVFVSKSTGTVYFKLKTSCANPIGNMPGLPVAPHWDLTGVSTVASSTAARAVNITATPGQTVTFYHDVTNSSGSTTATTTATPETSYNGVGGSLPASTIAIAGGTSWLRTANFTIPTTATGGEKYCQRIVFTDATGPGKAGGKSVYACVTVSATSYIDGVKIDNSGSGAYGGNCATVGPNPSACTGTLAQYPFSDDAVTVSGQAGMSDNYFADSTIPAGSHTISVSPGAGDGYWRVVGYSICDADAVSDCTSANMGYGDKYFKAMTATTTSPITFADQHHYHMRWVYRYLPPGSFTVTANATGSGFNDSESPTSLSSAGTATVVFTYPNGALVAATVNLSYTAQYTLVHASGATVAYPLACSGTSGTTSVTGPIGSGTRTSSVSSNCAASAPPLVAGDKVCVVYTFTPRTGTVDPVTGAVSNTSGSASDQQCFAPLINKPYAHFFGLDVSAGGSFANGLGDQCSTAPATIGNIQTFVRTGAALARGSSGQFAALANGSIDGYNSASLRTATPMSPDDLTFANSGLAAGAHGALGVPHCVPDYFATKSASTPVTASTSLDVGLASFNGNGNSAVEEQLYYSALSGFTVKNSVGNGSGIAKGNRVAVYVTGDVYIKNDIKFKQTNWASVDEIPSFYLIVKGNIYIDPSVTELDGVYVAQPTGASGGTINTCAPGTPAVSTLFSAAQLFNSCQNQLTVNGAFVANTVNLLRTANSLRNSMGGEQPTVAPGNCSTNARTIANYDCAAEIFNFSPEVYLGHPGFDPIGGPAVGKYDYITSLSPVL